MSRAWTLLLAVGVLLVACNWQLGMDGDEQIQLTALLGKPLLEGATAPWNLYDFGHVRDDPDSEVRQKEQAVFRGDAKWCENPMPFKVFFFRPLSSAFLWLEFQIFGLHLRLYHLLQIVLLGTVCALFAAIFNRVLEASGLRPLPAAALVALSAASPVNQEILARICTVHYLIAALCGLGSYSLILGAPDLKPALRGALVLALGAASLFASEAALQVHALGCCAMAVHARTLRREQRIIWALLVTTVVGYFVWYTQSDFDAAGYGYGGLSGTTQAVWDRVGRIVDAGLDLFGGTFLTQVSHWIGVVPIVGRRAIVPALVLSAAFLYVVRSFMAHAAQTRVVAGALLAGAALAALPVAAVAQSGMRILALPSLALHFLLCLMARDSWLALAAGQGRTSLAGRGGARGAGWAGVVLGYVCLRLGANLGLTPVALHEVSVRSRVYAARWTGDLGTTAANAGQAAAQARSASSAGDANVLINSGVTGVPYPFGEALLARNGFAPDVRRWLFLSDLGQGAVQITRTREATFQVSQTPQAARFNAGHLGLYPLAQRCRVVGGSMIETRLATFLVGAATGDGEPLVVDLMFRPEVTPRFWALTDGRIVPAELPALGQTRTY